MILAYAQDGDLVAVIALLFMVLVIAISGANSMGGESVEDIDRRHGAEQARREGPS